MLLIEDDPADNARLGKLSAAARSEWLATVGYCSRLGTDILEGRDIAKVPEPVIEEWEQAGLAARAPFGAIRMLGRGWIWEFDGT